MAVPATEEMFEKVLTPKVYRRAWNYACRLSATREDAEDLLQEALARAWRGLGRLRQPERFGAWLITIIRNCFVSATGQREVPLESYWHQVVQASGTDGPLTEEVAAALNRLPQTQRELLSLYYLDGLSLKETGWVLGIQPQVAGQRLYRARQALRRVLIGPGQVGVKAQECKR